MLERIRQFLTRETATESSADLGRRMAIATAALLVEVMTTDGLVSAGEEAEIERLLSERFGLSAPDAAALLDEAKVQSASATSLYPLTTLVNRHWSAEQKFELLRALWLVAYSDEFLNKHEEGVIRHIAQLLYIPHSQFLRARNLARGDPR